MGVFDWLFRKSEKSAESSIKTKQKPTMQVPTAPCFTFTMRMEKVALPPIAFDIFTCEIAGSPVRAEVPVEAKAKCERLIRKSNRSVSENEFLHNNYWVNVYYKNEHHGYHGINDIWTYSARDLPELPLLHNWIYSILGKKKPKITGVITTVRTWEDQGTIYALGSFDTIRVQVSFKPRGFVLGFLVNDDSRWEDKASFNAKTGQGDFPFYYSDTQGKIVEWGKNIFEEKRPRSKGIAGKSGRF